MLLLKIKKTVGRRRPFNLDIELDFGPDKRMVVFFGPSGSGKTLALSCIAGLVQPDAGLIRIEGREVFNSAARIDISPQKRHVGYMPQDYGLFPHLTLLENVAYPKSGFLGRHVGKKEKAAALGMLARLGLDGLEDNHPGELSGGQKQRAALARALNSNPSLLLLDEPFSALDPLLRQQLREGMSRFLASLALPLVVISHDPEDADVFGQAVAFFMHGRAKIVPDYQEIRKKFPTAGECLLSLQKELYPDY